MEFTGIRVRRQAQAKHLRSAIKSLKPRPEHRPQEQSSLTVHSSFWSFEL